MRDVKEMTANMPRKIQVTLPDRIGDDLQRWADYDGRPLANLCNFLLERAVIEAREKGAVWTKTLKPEEQDDKNRRGNQ